RRDLGSFEYLAALTLVAAVVMTPLVLVSGESLAVPELTGWLIIVFIALVNGAIGHFLMNWAHAHVPIVVVSLLTLAIPVFATASAAVFLDESVTAAQVAGMAVVIGALALVVLKTSRRVPETAESPGSPAVEHIDEP